MVLRKGMVRMNGKQSKALRRVAGTIWAQEVQPVGENIIAQFHEAGDDDVLKNSLQQKLLQLPTPRRLYRRLKYRYNRRA